MEFWSNKKILSFTLGTVLLALILFAGCFSFLYLKIGEKFSENEKLMASIITTHSENEKQTAEKTAENQQEPTGEDFKTKNIDWENVKVLVENTTDQEGLEVKIADKFKKLGCLNIYTTKISGVPYQDTLVQYCAGCSDIALELLSVLHDSEGLLIKEESGLSDEIRIKLGTDQIIIANNEITISILNGSDVIGVARKLKDEMAGQGFNIIKAGDADKKDYQKTIIKYSLNNLEKADIVKDYLSASYNNLEMFEDSGLPTDIEIILGAKNDQETSI
ncbi:MAG: LytR C-terminal domain-containing protein [Candidatus Nealsonbacteria bacterium]|nr:LytR C-terminal domain-containing protein [Candidatus Nealsonbacteria bacterium]